MTTVLGAALATGLLGSLHCTAMCGPLALAGCSRGARIHRGSLAGYLLGRLVVYALIGALFGQIGAGAARVLRLNDIQSIALLAVAALALGRGLRLLRWSSRSRPPDGASPSRPRSRLLTLVVDLVPRRGLGLGMATGLLPCGLLVAGWALAASTGHPLKGAGVMAAFNLATLPGLLVPLVAAGALRRPLARLSPRVHGLAWCAVGLWLLLRPLLMATHSCHY